MTPRERLQAWLESADGDPCHAGTHLGYERYGSMKVGVSDGIHYPICSAEEVLTAFDALDPALQDEFVEEIVECPA